MLLYERHDSAGTVKAQKEWAKETSHHVFAIVIDAPIAITEFVIASSEGGR